MILKLTMVTTWRWVLVISMRGHTQSTHLVRNNDTMRLTKTRKIFHTLLGWVRSSRNTRKPKFMTFNNKSALRYLFLAHQTLLSVFNCEDAALQVLMSSVHLSVIKLKSNCSQKFLRLEYFSLYGAFLNGAPFVWHSLIELLEV